MFYCHITLIVFTLTGAHDSRHILAIFVNEKYQPNSKRACLQNSPSVLLCICQNLYFFLLKVFQLFYFIHFSLLCQVSPVPKWKYQGLYSSCKHLKCKLFHSLLYFHCWEDISQLLDCAIIWNIIKIFCADNL